jgi:shikimate kinase/3-dehydroquinate synthase
MQTIIYFGQMNNKTEHIFIYGPPAVGKTTIAALLAENLSRPWIDLDAFIQQTSGRWIPEIFKESGEEEFRRLESLALEKVVQYPPSIIALGGGALLDDGNRSLVETSGEIILLNAPIEILQSRAQQALDERPLLSGQGPENLRSLLAARQAHYDSFQAKVDTSLLGANEAAWEIQRKLGIYHLAQMVPEYDVRILPGGFEELPTHLTRLACRNPIPIVCDSNVENIYAARISRILEQYDYKPIWISVPAGEKSKSLKTAQTLWEAFLKADVDRKSIVLALGGGMIGDLTGFAAATYMRGIGWINLPTSLLAQVDASIGGKTGVNLPQGKNLVGVFHPPRLVLSDPEVLRTLPDPEFNNGMAEIIKHGLILDPDLYQICQAGSETIRKDLFRLVSRAVAVKVKVVENDPFEKGLRQILNAGHTIGHAVEKASGFSLRHGEAVAIGLVAEAFISVKLGLAHPGLYSDLAHLMRLYELPATIPNNLKIENILEYVHVDKKRSQGKIKFALPVDIGHAEPDVIVEDLPAILEEFSKLPLSR